MIGLQMGDDNEQRLLIKEQAKVIEAKQKVIVEQGYRIHQLEAALRFYALAKETDKSAAELGDVIHDLLLQMRPQ